LNYSVVIPTHNRPDFLENAIRSVFNQNIRPREIIVVDDIGLIVVENLIKKLIKEFNFKIQYIISNSKNGVSHSYNLGAFKVKADYLAFLDDDDFWGKDYIKQVDKIILNKKIDIIITRLTQFDNLLHTTKPGKCPSQKFDINDYYLANPGVIRSNIFLKRSIFELAKGYDESIFGSSDKDLFMRLKKLDKIHYVLDKPNLVYWRTNHKSQASTNSKRMLRNVRSFYKKYFFLIPFKIHIKMIKKIFKLFYISIRK